MEYTAPILIPVPFSANGEKNTIPQTVSDPSSNQASYSSGFPPVTMVPRVSGGKPPQGKDMNGILYELSSNIQYLNAGGQARFNQDFCTAIGGYPKGAVLQSDADMELFLSLVDNNTNNPNSDLTNWKALVGGSADEDYWRIGTTTEMTSTTLPDGYMWCDRSLALFSDYPRLQQKYLNGGFDGMVLPANATSEEIENNPRKFVLSEDDQGNANGLYVYDLDGLFPRYGTSENAGTKNNAGLPNIIGEAGWMRYVGSIFGTGALSYKTTSLHGDNGDNTRTFMSIALDASKSNSIYGSSDTVMPDSYNQPIAIYLG